MSSLQLKERYAAACYTVINKEEADISLVLKELIRIKELFNNSQELYAFLITLSHSREQRIEITQRVLRGYCSNLSLKIICFLIFKGRIEIFEEIVNQLEFLYNQEAANKKVCIITPHPIDKSIHNSLNKLLKKLGVSESIEFKNEIDPSLIGGCIVRFSDRQLDFSMLEKLEQLKKHWCSSLLQNK